MNDERVPVRDSESVGLLDRMAERGDTVEAELRVQRSNSPHDVETGFEACSAIFWVGLLAAMVLAGILGFAYLLTIALS